MDWILGSIFMRRYWIPKSFFHTNEITNETEVHFQDEVFHHIFDVCRQGLHSKFEVLPGDNKAYFVEVFSLEKRKAKALVKEFREIPSLKKPHLHLALSIPRFPVLESVLEKSVEMGAHTLHPFFSDFSFIRKESSLPSSKKERWNKIIVSATQQCGRGELMAMSEPTDLKNILNKFNQTKGQLGLFCYEGQSTLTIKEALKKFHSLNNSELSDVWIFIGSEGGFSDNEVQLFLENNLHSITLGEQVLRVETACITMLAILKYELQ